MPRVTWLLPVRDAMPYLPAALASIEAQKYRDFEVLAWDNGSADGSVDVLRRWIPERLPGRIVEDHAPGLFPNVASDLALEVWRFFSSMSSEHNRGRPPSPRHILKLARAGAESAGWDRNAMARLEKTREQMRTCARLRPAWTASWLSIEISMRLRLLLAHSG